MCVNYQPVTRDDLEAWFGIPVPESLDWPDETWQDYAAPIIVAGEGEQRQLKLGSYGMVPKRHIPPHVKKYTTMNARSETAGQLRSYSRAWKNSQLCLVPMRAFFEPNWETGTHTRFRIARPDGSPFAAAGIWREWEEADGSRSVAFTQLTVNADDHPVLNRFHRPGEEKRSLVIVPPEEYDAWLACRDPELARTFMRLLSPDHYACAAAPTERAKQASLFG